MTFRPTLTTPSPDNPTAEPEDAAPAPAAKPPPSPWVLRARLGVVVLLCLGLLVFGVYAFNDLAKGLAPAPPDARDNTLALSEGTPGPSGGDLLGMRNANDALSPQYLPLDHDPGHFALYPGAQRVTRHQLPQGNGYRDEHATYTVRGADAIQVIDHYRVQAVQAGYTANVQRGTRDNPDKIAIQLILDGNVLTVTAEDRNFGPPPPPPGIPHEPEVSLTVQFRYPIASQR